MNYLIYIEHAAENLQFFLWYRDYVKRFDAMPASERALAPVWTMEQAEAEAMINQNNQSTLGPKTVSAETAAVFKGTDVSESRFFEQLVFHGTNLLITNTFFRRLASHFYANIWTTNSLLPLKPASLRSRATAHSIRLRCPQIQSVTAMFLRSISGARLRQQFTAPINLFRRRLVMHSKERT